MSEPEHPRDECPHCGEWLGGYPTCPDCGVHIHCHVAGKSCCCGCAGTNKSHDMSTAGLQIDIQA